MHNKYYILPKHVSFGIIVKGVPMKKIKILTFHNAENYGANLQAYALKEVIKDMGVMPFFINYQDKFILKDYKLIRTNSLKSFLSSLWYYKRNLKRKKKRM